MRTERLTTSAVSQGIQLRHFCLRGVPYRAGRPLADAVLRRTQRPAYVRGPEGIIVSLAEQID